MSPRDHSYYQNLLDQHISGEALAPEARMGLFDHIETCDDCRLILEAEERITARMKTIPRLVAPSDLRSKIVLQAVRDYRERTTTPSEDPTVADILRPVDQGQLPVRGAALRAKRKGAELPVDDLPVFSGVLRPQPSRVRQVWRRSSPVLATGFLVVTSVGALYTGHFQGIPIAGQAQQMVWHVADSAMGRHDPYKNQTPAPAVPPAPVRETIIEPAPIIVAGLPGSATPLPGTSAVTDFVVEGRRWLASVDSTVAALARATNQAIPEPAEKATPQIAALVLRPTDRDNRPGGFRESELAAALEAMAETQPGGQLTHHDQFAMGGQRYRMYTLNLPAGATNRIVETLTPYQAPADGGIVNVLASQDQVNASRNENIRFFASNEKHLRSALETITPVSANGGSESIRVVVVE